MKRSHIRSNSGTDFFFERLLIEIQKAHVGKIDDTLSDEKKRFRKTSLIRNIKLKTECQNPQKCKSIVT